MPSAGWSRRAARIPGLRKYIFAILANNLVFDKVNEFLRPEHFADALHGRIYEAVGKLIESGQIANVLTLKNLFDQDPALAEHRGAQYLAQLADLGEEMVNSAHTHDLDLSAVEQIETAEQHLYNLAETGDTEGGLKPFTQAPTGGGQDGRGRGAAGGSCHRHRHRSHRPRQEAGRAPISSAPMRAA
jgi:hypothetical protein